MSVLEIILGIVSGIGGWQLINYILDWIKKRKTTKKADIVETELLTQSVSDKAIQILKDQLEVLDDRLKDKEVRITELESQIKELRKIIDDNYNEMSKMRSQLDKVCLRLTCKNRIVIGDL